MIKENIVISIDFLICQHHILTKIKKNGSVLKLHAMDLISIGDVKRVLNRFSRSEAGNDFPYMAMTWLEHLLDRFFLVVI